MAVLIVVLALVVKWARTVRRWANNSMASIQCDVEFDIQFQVSQAPKSHAETLCKMRSEPR
jgi:hypothetical protein